MTREPRPPVRRCVPAGAAARGFTLIELVIALAVTLIVASLVLTVFSAQAESYRRQEDLSKTQQNLRLAMEIVTRDLAMAGYGFSASGEAWGEFGSDGLGTEGDPGEALATLWLIQRTTTDKADAVEIAYMDPDTDNAGIAFGTVPPACNTDTVTFVENDWDKAGNFTADDTIVCVDPGAAAGPKSLVWDVSGSGNTTNGTVPVTAGSSTDFTAHCTDGTGNGLAREMTCSKLVRVVYYIDSDSGDGAPGTADYPALMLSTDGVWPEADDIPIAFGIEDMQFDLCLATQDCKSTGAWSNDYATIDTRTYGWTSLKSVTVRMLARSQRTNMTSNTVSMKVDLSDDGSDNGAASADGYHRRIASTEVALRNAQSAWQLSEAY